MKNLMQFRADFPFKPYEWHEGIGEVMSYPFVENDGSIRVFARKILGDPTSARYVIVAEPCGNCDVEGLIPAGKTSDDCVVCCGTGVIKTS